MEGKFRSRDVITVVIGIDTAKIITLTYYIQYIKQIQNRRLHTSGTQLMAIHTLWPLQGYTVVGY